MKILLANKFFYNRGGAERWVLEVDPLLRESGHETVHFSMKDGRNQESSWSDYFVSPVSYDRSFFRPSALKGVGRMFYSGEVERAVRRLVQTSRPDIALLGNVYHQLGPALILTLARLRIPMVMMLHDYKPVCPSYLLFRKGRPCEQCSHGRFFRSAVYGCGGSRLRGLCLALESYWQKNILKTYEKISGYIAPSRFLASKADAMGFGHPVSYVPNFVSIPAISADPAKGRAIGCAGRVSQEKGLDVLLAAAAMVPSIPIRIAGAGPLLEAMQRRAPANVTFVGHLSGQELTQEMLSWRAAAVPSLWYENSPYAILEAFAAGLPVVGSDAGGITELVKGRGVLFPLGNASALANALQKLWENPELCRNRGSAAQEFVRTEHSPERFYASLLPILTRIAGTKVS
jgi:glycosyltransferase involved in cell wall biosynthesis